MVTKDELEIELHEPTKLHSDGNQSSLRILMDPAVHAGIDSYAASDKSRELGGILLGSQLTDAGQRFILVEGYITALHTDSQRASLTFTHQSWDQMHTERERRYPGLKIVGWFHTHPGFGIFLSNYDLFIHRSFFDLPWQIAYVVDPLQKTCGYFRWEAKEIVPSEYQLLPRPKLEQKIPVVTVPAPGPVQQSTTDWLPKVSAFVAAILCVATWRLIWQANNRRQESAHPPESGKTDEQSK